MQVGPDGRLITGLEGEKRKEIEHDMSHRKEKVSRTREYAEYVRANAFGGQLHKFRNPRERQSLFPHPLTTGANDYGIHHQDANSSSSSAIKVRMRGRNGGVIQSSSVQSLN